MVKNRTELVHCDNCGEDYAATYRRCPFCDAKADQRSKYQDDSYEEPYDEDDSPAYPHGGKRLAGGQRRRGPDRGVAFWVRAGLYALSALVIIAAIWIMCTQLLPKLTGRGGAQDDPSAAPSPSVAPSVEPSAEPTLPPVLDPAVDDPLSLDSPDLPSVEPDPISSLQPLPSLSPAPSATPAVATTTTPAVTTTPAPSAALKLSNSDFTLSPKYPTYQMEIEGVGRTQATYSMSNEAVATVSSSGLITAVGNGNTKLTVTDKNGNTATAIVRVSGMSAQAAAPSDAPAQSAAPDASTGDAKLNHTDFSITASYPDPVRLRVQNGEAASWSSSNPNVATVSDNGTVTGVGNGNAKITCTLTSGGKLTCNVYVSGK